MTSSTSTTFSVYEVWIEVALQGLFLNLRFGEAPIHQFAQFGYELKHSWAVFVTEIPEVEDVSLGKSEVLVKHRRQGRLSSGCAYITPFFKGFHTLLPLC